jgi:hypothetical protein
MWESGKASGKDTNILQRTTVLMSVTQIYVGKIQSSNLRRKMKILMQFLSYHRENNYTGYYPLEANFI